MSRRRDDSVVEGLLCVDKPVGPTSHDVVARFRRHLGTRRCGHAGTLDPTASGLLVLGFGRATRLLGLLGEHDKAYDATIRLGAATSTDDAAGELESCGGAAGIGRAEVLAAVPAFTGPILQRPSKVSAVHVAGRRAHELVRAGEQVELPARPVTVHSFDVHDVRGAELDGVPMLDVDVSVVVSSGTYVRALARDLGTALGVGGHLISLRRTRIGPFDVSSAVPVDPAPDAAALLPLATAVGRLFPRHDVDAADADRVRHGIRLPAPPALGDAAGPVGVFGHDGEVLALAEVRGGELAYLAVLATPDLAG